ncbi:MAG: hypothetical protein F6J86_10935 [Symploca sp. SIO1B1]|nr:hypothetical protein [Symploca sp. SIO1B1]
MINAKPPTTNNKQPITNNQLQLLVIIGFLIIGSLLRLLWAADMEWKSEEQWMFNQAQQIVNGTIPLPISGILSSIGIPNPGMGVWCFAAIAKFADDPVSMARGVQLLNIAALWLFFAFVLRQIGQEERHTWLWGLAIASVNPLAIILSRKIWIPDLLAPFCFLIFLGHWFRQKFWGSFLWGIASICSGQVHMGGFFVVIGIFCWTVWHDGRKKILRKIAWMGYIFGNAIGSIPLLLWLWEVLPQWQGSRSSIVGLLVPKFYSQWLTTALGINLSYSLKDFFWQDFLREPLIFGIPTYLMVPAHLFLVGIGIYPFYRWLKRRKKAEWRIEKVELRIENGEGSYEKNFSEPGNESRLFPIPNSQFPLRSMVSKALAQRDGVRQIPHSQEPKLNLYLKALGFGVGGTFTLLAVNVPPYYMALVFPFTYIWLAQLYRHKTKLLLAIVLVQLLISLTFLIFIHRTGGIPFEGSGYGTSYRFQMLN